MTTLAEKNISTMINKFPSMINGSIDLFVMALTAVVGNMNYYGPAAEFMAVVDNPDRSLNRSSTVRKMQDWWHCYWGDNNKTMEVTIRFGEVAFTGNASEMKKAFEDMGFAVNVHRVDESGSVIPW